MQHCPASKDAGLFVMPHSAAVKPTRKAPRNKTLVQEQFDKPAATYLTSTPHTLGKNLERLVALTSPQKTWRPVAAHT
jgi:hypothetical protein